MADEPVDARITSVDPGILSQITEAQTKGIASFSKQMEQISTSLKSLETTLPRAVADAIKATAGTTSAGNAGRSANASVAGSQAVPTRFMPSDPNKPIGSRAEWEFGQSPDPSMSNQQFYQAGGFNRFASRATSQAAGFENPGDYQAHMRQRAAEAAAQYGPTAFQQRFGRLAGQSSNASVARSGGAATAFETNMQAAFQQPGMSGRFIPRFSNQSYNAQDYGFLAGDVMTMAGNQMKQYGSGDLGANMATAGGIINNFAGKYAPIGYVAQQIGGPSIARRADRTDIGTIMGGNPETGDIEGPFGFGVRTKSILTNDATRRGMAAQMEAAFAGRAAGVSGKQAGKIIAGVAGNMGYKPSSDFGALTEGEDSRYKRAVATQLSLYRRNPYLVNPLEEKMYEQATRYGTSDEEKQFRRSMKELADISDATGLSIDRLQQSSNSLATELAQQGAMNSQETALAYTNAFTRQTGMDPEVGRKMRQSGMFRANAMVGSGLAPWQLSLMTPNQNMATMYQTLGDVSRMVGPTKAKMGTNAFGKPMVLQSAEDLKYANMAQYLPGMEPMEIKRLMENKDKFTAENRIESMFGVGSLGTANVGGYVKSGNQNMWNKINEMMKQKDAQGKDLFSKEERARVYDAGNVTTEKGRKKQFEKLQEIEKEHAEKIAKKYDKKGGKSTTVGDVTIELSKTAASMFNLKNVGKATALGGGSPMVQTMLSPLPGGQIMGALIDAVGD